MNSVWNRRWRVAIASLLIGAVMCGCGAPAAEKPAEKKDQPAAPVDSKYGGTLVVAVPTNPTGLDMHTTTATVTTNIMCHVYETFFTIDENLMLVPHLVDTYEVKNNNTEYVFHMRAGVKFHNGKEMTAEDVIASFERWGQLCGRGTSLFKNEIVSLVAEGTHTVKLTLKAPNGIIPLELSDFQSQYVAIMPADIARKHFTTPIADIADIVGTGPFKVIEFTPDVHTRLDRFEDYSARKEDLNGRSGNRIAYVDTILFRPIPDAMVRVNSVEVGESHYAEEPPTDEYARALANPNLEVVLNPLTFHAIAFINMKSGLLAESKLLRQAMLAALNLDEIMIAAYGSGDLWMRNHSTLPKSYPLWTSAGAEFYNRADTELAKKLMRESGYDGQPIVWLSTTDYAVIHAATQVAVAQLRSIGFNIDLKILDWSTVMALRQDPEAWNVFNTTMGPRPDPVIKPHFNPGWGPYWSDPKMLDIVREMRAETDFAERMKLNDQLHLLIAEEVPMITFGHYHQFDVHSPKLKGFTYKVGGPFFWNTWLEDK